ncbi:hemerythrin domain-containing protein [Azospirillum soli]|uniref:hemerythrin domain-containing protein n=1 Tax=Azospirillum soli TaxID=1304799 RepID=UPI001FE4AF7D|nr:hemerythrin domain-containing protein [Azospirillum soli]MBP2311156.1 hemerythrin-like domain-containing protein [Azospirillum soli]
MNMAKFYEHHGEVRALAARIEGQLDPARIAANPAGVSADVLQLFGKFSVHLTIEDQALYPRLAQDSNAEVRRMATAFQNEMGGLKTRFDAYRKAWPGPMAIAKDPARFVSETREVLTLLKTRIEREDRQLYPLAERAAA